MSNWTIRICQGVNCQNYLSEDLYKHALKLTSENDNITVEKRGCMNRCSQAPNMQVVNNETGETVKHNEIDFNKIETILKNLSSKS